MKVILSILTIVVVIGGGYYFFSTPTDTPTPSDTPVFSSADFVWHIENASNFDDSNPKQNLFLDVKGKRYPVGEYTGCDVSSNSLLEPGEITRQTCWFAGGGHHIGVFLEDGRYIVKERWIQESGGPEVNAPTEGPFEVLFAIE